VARPWRLRHKLVLGVALVIASIGSLLAGALFGLSSYVEAGRVTEHKLQSIYVAAIIRDHIHEIASGKHEQTLEGEKGHILRRIGWAREALEYYRGRQAEMPRNENWEDEEYRLAKIERLFSELEAAVRTPDIGVDMKGNRRILEEHKVKSAYDALSAESTELMQMIRTHIQDAMARAHANHRRGLIIAVSASVTAIILVLTLLYYFRVWVFTPIQLLQAGVQRVHGGDFDHPIQLQSQDELEELANEFNAMTARLRAIYADLARQVNERSRQLVRSERMVSVGFLAAGVAHEINNPLASIAFCAEAMERRLQDLLTSAKGADAEAIIKYLKVVQQEAFRCKQITQKLLDFSRSGERRREPTDLSRLIQDVIDVTRVLPDHRTKTIRFAAAPLVAAVSPPDIKSVVLNLIINALESMEDDGVLTIDLRTNGDLAELVFRDTGCGMTAEIQENIFEPFFTRRRTGNGTGLGLSISHQIIDQHGGSIHAASDGPGQGSTFIVRLPLRVTASAPWTMSGGQPEGSQTPQTIPFPGTQAAA
jgi:two-component system NtrC family sensor kinase